MAGIQDAGISIPPHARHRELPRTLRRGTANAQSAGCDGWQWNVTEHQIQAATGLSGGDDHLFWKIAIFYCDTKGNENEHGSLRSLSPAASHREASHPRTGQRHSSTH